MNKTIDVTDLDSLINNHKNNLELPILTKSVVIDLLQLDKFILQAKNTPFCDAIKIYFVRYPLPANQDHIITPGNNLSQISLAFVPAKFIKFDDWTAKDLKDQDGNNIFTLLVCVPGYPRDKSDKNSLCPPKGSCP